MALGLFDRPTKASTMLEFPELYKLTADRSDFNMIVSHFGEEKFVKKNMMIC